MKSLLIATMALTFTSTTSSAEWQPNNHTNGQSSVSTLVYNTYADALGDTFGQTQSHDITNFSAYRNNGSLELTLDYQVNLQGPEGIIASEIIGYIDIDADANTATGISPGYNNFCSPALEMGSDYFIGFGMPSGPVKTNPSKGAPQSAILFDSNENFVAQLPATFSANQVAIELPLNLINDPANSVYFSVVVGNDIEPTDCAPDAAILTTQPRGTVTAVPTLSTMALLALIALLSVIGIRQRQTD